MKVVIVRIKPNIKVVAGASRVTHAKKAVCLQLAKYPIVLEFALV